MAKNEIASWTDYTWKTALCCKWPSHYCRFATFSKSNRSVDKRRPNRKKGEKKWPRKP